MKKRILMAGMMAVTAIVVLAGAYAFFTDKKDIKVSATAAKLGITVDKTKFSDDLVANMVPGDTRDLAYTIKKEAGSKDAIVFSPHKFPGGPGSSGVMVVRDAIARTRVPTLPGGGTVSFVSPWGHTYSSDLAAREADPRRVQETLDLALADR